jgi:hypothetical protein
VTPPETITVPRELLVRADSMLSLLWHRPSTPRDVELALEVNRVIADLRRAYEQGATP